MKTKNKKSAFEVVKLFSVGIMIGLMLHFAVQYAFKAFRSPQQQAFVSQTVLPAEIPAIPVSVNKNDVVDEISNSRRNAITISVEKVSPAVVGINVTQVREVRYRSPFYDDPFFRSFFPDQVQRKRVENLGSGFIISPDGYVLTNEHVINNATQIVVTTSQGNRFDAEVVGYDYESDVALLKIEAENLPYIKFGDSEDLMIGEWVIALGNPFGLFTIHSQPTVTVGVLSASNRDFDRNEEGRVYVDMIQTDAAINRGNSGGPLVNSMGLLIGMNTMIFTETGGSIGLGFAIPSNKLYTIYNDLKARGKFEKDVWLGFNVQNVDRLIAISLRLPEISGVIVTEIEKGGSAEVSGLEITDVIIGINEIKINNFNDVQRILRNRDLRVGDKLKLAVIRSGEKKDIILTLGKRRS